MMTEGRNEERRKRRGLENLLYLKIMKEGVVVVVDDFKKIFHI